ncbi:MAG TPA: aldose 1-epimerase family protein [Cytophagaceae bacterium]|jgi:galactose mutarotase-like enzyme
MIAILINEFLKVTVKNSGAELISLKNTMTNKEYLWQGDPNFWGRRAPVLFPIVGKVNRNKYKVDGTSYELPQHGFARDMHFEQIDHQESTLAYLLKSNDQTLKVYPYKFELLIKYQLERNRLIVSYDVKNIDDKVIYFSIGAHPAFNCPLEKNEKFEDYYLEFEKKETASRCLLQDGLISDKSAPVLKDQNTLPLDVSLFNEDAIIFKELRSREVAIKSKKSNHQIKMDFTGFPYFAIWSKKGGAPFVCLEPWFGIADKAGFTGEYKEKDGIRSLSKGKSFHGEYSIEIS